MIEFLYANSVDPDQMPHSVASDLGLHCLPRSLLLDDTIGINGFRERGKVTKVTYFHWYTNSAKKGRRMTLKLNNALLEL